MNVNFKEIYNKIPSYVFRVANVLNNNGYKAYLVGGAVRDLLISRNPKDYDIATNALPEEMDKIFDRCITTNARFGTVLVVMESDNLERFDVEVTTFRSEEDYYAGRWPTKVEFTSDIIKDLSRRDFTINAMALDLNVSSVNKGVTTNVSLLDPFNGIKDLEENIVRAVGIAFDRFSEDGLRTYKACRLASELGFKIEDETFASIGMTLSVARQISMERIRDEFVKCVMNSAKPSVGIELMRLSGLLEIFLPELIHLIGVTQPEYHGDDAYVHSLKVMDLAEDSVKIAALLHDIGKAETKVLGKDGRTHFYGHDQKGAEMTEQILKRLRFSNHETQRIKLLVKWHMFYYPSSEWRKENDINELANAEVIEDGGWTDAAIRRFINKVGEDLIEDLFKLRIADASANVKSTFNAKEIEALQYRIADIKAKDMALKISDLEINGNDLIALGIAPGREMGEILKYLLDLVIENPLINDKEILLKFAKEKRNK